ESASWRQPVDLVPIVVEAARELTAIPARRVVGPRRWRGHRDPAELGLEGEPDAARAEVGRLAGSGGALPDPSGAGGSAAARRAAHFPVANEFSDWETVPPAFTYANAVDASLRRAPSPPAARGILDAAMAVWLERFLNVPRRHIPQPTGAS